MIENLFDAFTKMFQTIWDTMFHRHTYDGTKWVKDESFETLRGQKGEMKKTGIAKIYNNTCLTCGELVSKLVKHIIIED